MSLDRKTISVSMPEALYDLMLKLRDDHFKGRTGNSEIVWECIKVAAAYKYGWIDENGELSTDPEHNKAAEIITDYEVQKHIHRKSDKGGGRPKSDDTKLKKQVKKVLQKSDRPLALIHIVNKIEGVSRKRLTRVLESMEGKSIVIHRPKEIGKAWSIALIGTEAEQRVNKLNRVEDNTERINKRRKRKKKRGKKRVRKSKRGNKKIRRTSK